MPPDKVAAHEYSCARTWVILWLRIGKSGRLTDTTKGRRAERVKVSYIMFIAVLEDEARREQAMRGILSEYPAFQAQFFDNAPDMIEWLRSHLAETVLISLDHDLGPNRRRSGQVFDPGTGRDVVDFLIQHPPTCPVIVHTSNGYSAPGMMFAFEYAHWSTIRVVPYNDLDWITQVWAKAVEENLPS